MSDTYYEENEMQNVSETVNAPAAHNASYLELWLNRLFWVLLAITVANALSGDEMEEVASGVYTFFSLVSVVCSVFYALILLKLSAEEALYRKSAYYWIGSVILAIVSIVVMVVGELLGGFGIALGAVMLLAVTVISLMGEYYEYQAHANVMQDADPMLSAKWRKLWNYFLGLTIGGLLATFVTALIPLLGILLVVALSIGLLVVKVLKFVYLYQMVKVFRA